MSTISPSTVQSADGTTIAYDRLGDGPPIVLVGGAIQHRAIDHTARALAERLAAADHTVVHYDRRGRGDSGDTLPYAIEREIEDLEAIIGEVGGRADVFAMSSGGALALEAAARGLSITKLALYEPPLMIGRGGHELPSDYVARLSAMIEAGRPGDALEFFMVDAVEMPQEMVDEMRHSPFWTVLEGIAHTLVYDGRLLEHVMDGERPPVERWASITVPAIVVDGEESPAYMREAVQSVTDALPHAGRISLAGQTHEFDADVLAPVLAEFFA
jgi:pimeloyl-ACP methyl ester carboxylesterase